MRIPLKDSVRPDTVCVDLTYRIDIYICRGRARYPAYRINTYTPGQCIYSLQCPTRFTKSARDFRIDLPTSMSYQMP